MCPHNWTVAFSASAALCSIGISRRFSDIILGSRIAKDVPVQINNATQCDGTLRRTAAIHFWLAHSVFSDPLDAVLRPEASRSLAACADRFQWGEHMLGTGFWFTARQSQSDQSARLLVDHKVLNSLFVDLYCVAACGFLRRRLNCRSCNHLRPSRVVCQCLMRFVSIVIVFACDSQSTQLANGTVANEFLLRAFRWISIFV